MLSEPGVAGSYEPVERRADRSLLLRPVDEKLSDVIRETEGQVFRDEEFAAHPERVAAAEDDLPPQSRRAGVPTFERLARFARELRRLPTEVAARFPGGDARVCRRAAREAAGLPARAADPSRARSRPHLEITLAPDGRATFESVMKSEGGWPRELAADR